MPHPNKLLLFALVVNFSMASSCGVIKPSVHYILPDGYVGMFKIILDEKNEVDVKLERGTYTLEIPQDGVLRIKSFTPFDAWHEVTASYKSGKEIPTLGTVADDSIALRDVGTGERGYGPTTKTGVIGTKAQEDKIRRDLLEEEFDNMPPAVYNQRLRAP
jgi:hypothetical protein